MSERGKVSAALTGARSKKVRYPLSLKELELNQLTLFVATELAVTGTLVCTPALPTFSWYSFVFMYVSSSSSLYLLACPLNAVVVLSFIATLL